MSIRHYQWHISGDQHNDALENIQFLSKIIFSNLLYKVAQNVYCMHLHI